MIGRDRVRNILQNNRFTGPWRRGDQCPLAFTKRGNKVDDPCCQIFGFLPFDFHIQPLFRVERCEVIEMHLVACLFRIFKIDGGNLKQGKIPLAIFRAADLTNHRIARTQCQTADLLRANINIIRSGQIVRFR